MNEIEQIRVSLQQEAIPEEKRKGVFFKTGKDEYAEHDQFIGVPVPCIRQVAKDNRHMALELVLVFLQSSVNEERLLALFILIDQYQRGDSTLKQAIYDLYKKYIAHINNWNLVDASAHLIIGAHLQNQNKSDLLMWAKSKVLWERRIAIVSTWYFIRHNNMEWTIKIAKLLLNDAHDLIHKATGWMLREAGKRQPQVLIDFLEQYALQMPRTMLRYSIEKLSKEERQIYLSRKSL